MVIHSVISIDDILNTPEYLKENGIQKETKARTAQCTVKKENTFSTDPFDFLKYFS